MPFCKRTIVPKDVCKADAKRQSALFGDLVDVCSFSLCSVLRQLADISRQSVSILEELEGELVSICHRSGSLEGRVIGLQRHISALSSKPPPKTATNLDAESKRAAHFRSPWQQNVNVFCAWSRPDCVEELHQQAQLNLQSLLQDFEEQLYDSKQTGQTFRHPVSCHSSDDASLSLSRSPTSLHTRPDFLFLSASRPSCEDDSSSSVGRAADPSPSPSPSGSDRPLLVCGSSSQGPPVPEKPRWHQGRHPPAHLTHLDGTGESKLLGVDLLQSTSSYSSFSGDQPRSLEPVTDTPLQHLPLRKTHSDLDASLPLSPLDSLGPSSSTSLGLMDRSSLLLCSSSPSSSWNGPPGSTFSPGAWNEAYSYTTEERARGNAGGCQRQQGILGNEVGTGDGGRPLSSQLYSGSFASETSSVHLRGGAGVTMAMMMGIGRRSETEGAVATGPESGEVRRERSARSIAAANAFKFRERSLSTPTDSESFCSTDNVSGISMVTGNGTATGNGTVMLVTDHRHLHHLLHPDRGESYALLYPSGSSEDGTSVDNLSVTGMDFTGSEGRLRLRSRSISLKKPKRKPPPPVRSVSLMKNLGDGDRRRVASEERLYRDGRPKSLHIPRGEHLQDFQPDFLLPVSAGSKPKLEAPDLGHGGLEHPPTLEVQGPDREPELSFPEHWQLGEWKSNDPYRSLSGSSTATGTTVIECMKVRGSSESLLDSPATSRATSPSQLSIEAETKGSSPFQPAGLMSPSSGYSSQAETPTPTIPTNQMAGTPTGLATTPGCKMRPKIPERKSSLPATSPRDPAARSRLSFEMPGNAHLELSSLKPKQKASRRHSDTSTTSKPGKVSPASSSALPVVSQIELRNIRLRSVSRSDLEDCPDGASDTIEEEQGRDLSSPPVAPKTKPPVAVKPPLPKRPVNLLLKAPSPSSSPVTPDSPPASPVDRPTPVGNIYKVMRRPKPKRLPTQTPPSPSEHTPQSSYDSPFLSHTQSLYDLPPLPDPQPLLEDPTLEPEFDPDMELRLGPEDGGSLPSPCSQESQELQDKSKTLPSRMTISCLAELEKKKTKVPPPVPKKPNVLLLPSGHAHSTPDRPASQTGSTGDLRSGGSAPSEETPSKEENQEGAGVEEEGESLKESSLQDSSHTEQEEKETNVTRTDDAAQDSQSAASERLELHISEDTDDHVTAHTPTTHTTEDLFTIIHRSKRRVLGRKEPCDTFGSRQILASPVKHSVGGVSGGGVDLRPPTSGTVPRSSSRNDTFMALLQKKGSRASGGSGRVSAAELLRSTNPLARRVTEFNNTPAVGVGPAGTNQSLDEGGGEESRE